MARPRKNRFVLVNVTDNTAVPTDSFSAAVAVISPDNPMPEGLKLLGIGADGSVSVATLTVGEGDSAQDFRIIRL